MKGHRRRHANRVRWAPLLGLGLFLFTGESALAGPSETLDEVDRELRAMRQDFDVVAKGYGSPLPQDTNRVDRRLREGEIHFLLNDFLRASIVLLDVVDDASNKSHPRYDDAVYFLAESLRRTNNFSGARRYFEEILPRASGERLKDIVLALLKISGETRQYEGVPRYLARLEQAGGLTRPDVNYIHGKMLFRRSGGSGSDLQSALGRFNAVPAGTPVSPQASYYAGVVLVSQGNNADAIGKFAEAADRAKAGDASMIRELSFLALGRLHHEAGDTSKAIDAYQEIATSSPHFEDMLFEVAWTHVRASRRAEDPDQKDRHLQLALQTSELLMASAPDHRLFAEARILEGNLQIKLGAPETAYETFQTIIDRYGGARDKLEKLMDTIGDPKNFFEMIVADDLGRVGSTEFLPPLAIEWANRSPQVRRAVGTIKDQQESRKMLKESREMARVLNDALRGEQRYAMFPGLSEARNKAFSIENRLVLVNRRLLRLELSTLEGRVDGTQKAQLEVMAARRRALEEDIQNLPRTTEDVASTTEDIRGAYKSTERRVFRQTYQIASMRAQLAAIEVWLGRNRTRLSTDQIKRMVTNIQSAKEKVAELEDDTDVLMADIRTASAISGGDGGRVRARRVRESYSQVMLQEFELLRGLRASLSSSDRSYTAKIDAHRATLAKMAADLIRLQDVLDQQVDTRVADIRATLAAELKRLEEYTTEERQLTSETDKALGPVAAESLSDVARAFRDIVRKADVGIIDVAWARKQQETQRVNDLVQKQQTQVRELEDEFADVLEGDDL